jgi:uncharacterized integral membrane protein
MTVNWWMIIYVKYKIISLCQCQHIFASKVIVHIFIKKNVKILDFNLFHYQYFQIPLLILILIILSNQLININLMYILLLIKIIKNKEELAIGKLTLSGIFITLIKLHHNLSQMSLSANFRMIWLQEVLM